MTESSRGNESKKNNDMESIFKSKSQAVLFLLSSIISIVCFIGMFFNPLHIVTFAMSAVLSIAIYKEKNW